MILKVISIHVSSQLDKKYIKKLFSVELKLKLNSLGIIIDN